MLTLKILQEELCISEITALHIIRVGNDLMILHLPAREVQARVNIFLIAYQNEVDYQSYYNLDISRLH
jgi:hypothetical protein